MLAFNGKANEKVKVEENQKPSGGGKVKAARRSSKTKEERPKLTRRKTPAKGTAKKSSVSKTPSEEPLRSPVNGANEITKVSPVVETQELGVDISSSLSSTPMYTMNLEHPALQADFQTQQQIAMQRFHQYQQQPFQQATYPGQQQQQQYVLPHTQQ